MVCPFCGKELEKGKIMVKGRDLAFFWARDEYFENHPFNPTWRFDSSIEKEGGVVVKTYPEGILSDGLPVGFYCRDCGKLTIDVKK